MLATLRKAVLFVLATLLLTPVAVAQNNRTAVSVNGSDVASCTVPDPCRTFAVALSKTNPNGEVVALTSGGYGPFTIDKPATIVAAPGIYAALVAASGDAIHVNAGARWESQSTTALSRLRGQSIESEWQTAVLGLTYSGTQM